MHTSYLITGASGNIGTALLEHLQANTGQQVYKATSHKGTLPETERWLDFEKPDSFAPALLGIEVVFLLRPPQLADVKKYFMPFISACQQAAHASHVIVAISANFVANTMQNQRAILEVLQRFHDPLQRELVAFFVRPEVPRHCPVRTEHDDKSLLASCRHQRRCKRIEIGDERQCCSTNAQFAKELSSAVHRWGAIRRQKF